jgi:hypothetical protein
LLAFFGQLQGLMLAFKQRFADKLLQRAQSPRKRRRAERQFRSGRFGRACPHDANKRLKRTQRGQAADHRFVLFVINSLSLRSVQPETGQAALVATCHFQSPAAGMFKHAPHRRHFPGQYHRQTAQRIDVFLNFRKPRVDHFPYVIQFDAGIGIPCVRIDPTDQFLRRIVMLVFDFPDDFLDPDLRW